MIKAFLCFWVSMIAGFATALVLALGIMSFGAASFKIQKGMDTLVAPDVVTLKTPMAIIASIGFLVGAGVIVWMFYGRKSTVEAPDEPGQTSRSEV